MSTESINTFNNVGKKWSDEDIELLKINYTDNNLSVHKLSIMCHRTMYAILCQLKKLNIIENLENANGYNEYIDLRDTEKEKLNDIKNNGGEKILEINQWYQKFKEELRTKIFNILNK